MADAASRDAAAERGNLSALRYRVAANHQPFNFFRTSSGKYFTGNVPNSKHAS